MNDIILSDTLIDLETHELLWNIKLVRQLGAHLVFNMVNREYEIVSVRDPIRDFQSINIDGKIVISADNMESIQNSLTEFIDKQSRSNMIWSNAKPKRRTIK
ncbi:hypothetical protein CsNV_043 [Callinectes sapidus nudivirus]|nr:hypothetical protein CsNV_043 [Callinectes sapidus nudivirus]